MKPLDTNQADDLLTAAAAKLQQHDVGGALDILVKAYQVWPDNCLILNMSGRCYQILGEFERAERCWQEALKIDPDNDVAESNLSTLQQPAFRSWQKRYKMALTTLEKKRFAEARGMLRQLMEEHDEFVSLYKVLGLSCLAEGDRDEAHRIWRKGLELDINNSSLQEYLAMPERRSIKFIKEEEPPKPLFHTVFTRRRLLILTGLLCLALVMQTGIVLNSHRQNVATTANLQQRIQQLTALVEQPQEPPDETVSAAAVEELSMEGSHYDVEQEEHYYLAGYQAYQAKDWKNAASNLGVVVSMQTGSYLNREALYYLARTYYLQEDYDQAEKYYLLYLDRFPASNYFDDSLFYLACTYYFSDRSQQAQEVLQQLEEWDPNSGYLSSSLYRTMIKD
ncbi:MAG: tetratricopeptide repeat protein [Syntrophomonadaceae bacterium]|jgi:tetratricopeptide (TPR) repeat protein|nr:tetratricopeptide repeat protein [Bacillota bacterium]NLP23150.1 tetratricopeptide repeat protein [Syntrophomonadaceae bacterium]